MNRAKLRLYVALLLFVAWIGYLLYLVTSTRDPVLLSRPQFLVSNLYVIGKADGDEEHPSGNVLVQEVPWCADEADRKLVGSTISVKKLDRCGLGNGWTGPDTYILPLSRIAEGIYLLTETPSSPGFNPTRDDLRHRIYPATESARRQLEEIIQTHLAATR